MEKKEEDEMSNNEQIVEIEEKSQNTDEEHKIHNKLLTDTNADELTSCRVNNREESKDENRNSLERNVELRESESSTSSDDDTNFILMKKWNCLWCRRGLDRTKHLQID